MIQFYFQAGHMWGNMFVKLPAIPNLSEWGYILQPHTIPRPRWITKPVISRKTHKELSTCGCKGECKPPCSCVGNKHTCTYKCGCNGMCTHTQTVMNALSEKYQAICDAC